MKRASAIVTNRGGRTCHAAIIARELGIPAVVGCGDATDLLSDGQEVTVSCAEGDTGFIYSGLLDVQITDVALDNMPKAPVKKMSLVRPVEWLGEVCRDDLSTATQRALGSVATLFAVSEACAAEIFERVGFQTA